MLSKKGRLPRGLASHLDHKDKKERFYFSCGAEGAVPFTAIQSH